MFFRFYGFFEDFSFFYTDFVDGKFKTDENTVEWFTEFIDFKDFTFFNFYIKVTFADFINVCSKGFYGPGDKIGGAGWKKGLFLFLLF